MFRISQNGQEPIVDVGTVVEIEPAIREFKARRYDVDEIRADPLPSGHTSRPWGTVISGAMGLSSSSPILGLNRNAELAGRGPSREDPAASALPLDNGLSPTMIRW